MKISRGIVLEDESCISSFKALIKMTVALYVEATLILVVIAFIFVSMIFGM